MFTFDATPVTFVGLLVLFAGSTAWSLYEATRPQDRRHRVSHVLHLGMAVVMLLMVARPTWGAVTALAPTPVWVVAFAVATGWFGWLASDAARASEGHGRRHYAGHTLMFAAMTWHLAAMATKMAGMSAGTASSPGKRTTGQGAAGPDMTGHAHGAATTMPTGGGMGTDWMTAQSQPGGVLWWFALVGLPLMAYLLVAALAALRRAVAAAPTRAGVLVGSGGRSCDDGRPTGLATSRMAAASEFAMSFGMFWMSTGLLVPILPFFSLFAF